MPTQPYHTEDGKRVPGTTTIIGRYKDSYVLLKWKEKNTRELDLAALQALGAKTKTVKLAEACRAISLAKTSSEQVQEEADAGTMAHQWIDEFAHDRERTEYSDATPEMITMATNGLSAFEEWWDHHQIKPVKSEIPLVSEEYRFGGTLDLLAKDKNGDLCMIDFKCANAVYGEQYIPQIAAYSWLVHENGLGKVKKFHLLRVSKKDASFHHHSWPQKTVAKGWELFKLYRKSYDIANYLKKL